jgi:hypothetical protein
LNSNATGGVAVAVVCPLLLLETGRESSVGGEAGVGRTGTLRAVMITIGGGHDGFYGLGVEDVSGTSPAVERTSGVCRLGTTAPPRYMGREFHLLWEENSSETIRRKFSGMVYVSDWPGEKTSKFLKK